MARLGIELGPHFARAVVVPFRPRAGLRPITAEWDPDDPLPGLRSLADKLGFRGPVYAAVDLSLLSVRRLSLPPVSPEQKRRMIQLDPSRYFAAPGELVLAVRGEDGLVFAVSEPRLVAWTEALAEIGPVRRIDSGPVALARALVHSGAPDPATVVRGDGDSLQVLEIEDGRLRTARRPYAGEAVSGGALEPAADDQRAPAPAVFLEAQTDAMVRFAAARWGDVEARPLEEVGELEPEYLTALGAALKPESGWLDSLYTPEMERAHKWREVRRRGLALATLVAALAFTTLSIDGRRERALERLESRTVELAQQATEARDLRGRTEFLRAGALAIAAIEAERPRPLDGLLELTRRLPPEAWIESIRATTDEWQIEGYAPDAAALVPLFEDDPRFEDVRSVSGTSRTRLNGTTYENFSLILRRVRAP